MKLSYEGLKDRAAWEKAGVRVPDYDWEATAKETLAHPVWVHFGSGSLVRAFHARLQQSLLEQGLAKSGIICAETFDYEIVDKVYDPYDNLAVMVSLKPDGSTEKEIVASVAKGLRASHSYPEDEGQLKEIFRNHSLQMITFTITEKGYALKDMSGKFTSMAEKDFAAGPGNCTLAMGWVAALLLERYKAGAFPLAVVSTDNCSHNGEKVRSGVVTMAEKWHENGFVDGGFLDWVTDEGKVSFPWTMIDKITPRPAEVVEKVLNDLGIEDMAPVVTAKKSFVGPFVNSEIPQYLVVEDRFPNGRPPLEKAGVYLTDRDTVNDCERMKVTTCLNPLHTALAVYGCLLGYTSIAAEMKDPELKALVEKIGYTEGMPVVVDPKILSPDAFIHEVVEQRFPNPFIPDTPQRFASDTSQKVGIRFGETIKSYVNRPELDVKSLTFIPLAIAGWIRYLLAVDDEGKAMELSGDPMMDSLQKQLEGVKVGDPESLGEKIRPILSNEVLFGSDLMALGLGEKIEAMVKEELAGPGAVRETLRKYLKS